VNCSDKGSLRQVIQPMMERNLLIHSKQMHKLQFTPTKTAIPNATDESDLQEEKQPSRSAPANDGITIHTNSFPENTFSSIRTNFDCDSNATDESDLHCKRAAFTKDFD
jgi:hypothetical protein